MTILTNTTVAIQLNKKQPQAKIKIILLNSSPNLGIDRYLRYGSRDLRTVRFFLSVTTVPIHYQRLHGTGQPPG